MGVSEKKVAACIRQTKINKAVISTVAAAGVLALAVVAPNAVGVLGRTKFMRQRMYRTKSSLSKLISQGYLKLELDGDKKRVRLTQKGERFAALLGEGSLVPKKPRRWDGKWRMLIFDIAERRRKARTQIRHTLTTLGFKRLQDSVWVYPYDCEDLMTLLKADLKTGRDVLYVIADTIEYDAPLRKHFGLEA